MNNKQYSRIALYFFVEDLTDPHKTTARLVSGMAHLNIESHVEVPPSFKSNSTPQC